MISIRKLVLGAGVLVLAAAAIGCSGGGDTIVQTEGPISGINVSGTGRVFGDPDLAKIQLGVQVERDSVEAAREEAASAMQGVIDSLTSNGVDDSDIQTTQFSIYPQYDFSGERQTLRGYQVNNVVSATLRDIETAGQIIDDAAEAGGDTVVVQGISFSIEDPTELQADAREQAVAQARARAEQLADNAGVDLGGPLSITESQSYVDFPEAATNRASFDTATPIQSGELAVEITVQVVYSID